MSAEPNPTPRLTPSPPPSLPPGSLVTSELVLIDRSTGEQHKLFVKDGHLIWDNGGNRPLVSICVFGGGIQISMLTEEE